MRNRVAKEPPPANQWLTHATAMLHSPWTADWVWSSVVSVCSSAWPTERVWCWRHNGTHVIKSVISLCGFWGPLAMAVVQAPKQRQGTRHFAAPLSGGTRRGASPHFPGHSHWLAGTLTSSLGQACLLSQAPSRSLKFFFEPILEAATKSSAYDANTLNAKLISVVIVKVSVSVRVNGRDSVNADNFKFEYCVPTKCVSRV